jgi:hypothetical protein
MLNLSDKDLDRLSQEAAQHHEPGDVLGPRLWEKLELRLDRDLGKIGPNPARGIRRLPFYYAPAMLALLGIAYYLVKLNNRSHTGMPSASPPFTLTKPTPAGAPNPSSSSQNAEQSNKPKSTLTAPSNTVPYPGTPGASNARGASATAAPPTTTAPDATAAPNATATPGAPPSSGAAVTPRNSGTPSVHGNSLVASAHSAPGITPDRSNNSSAAVTTSRHRHGHNLSPSPGSTGNANPGLTTDLPTSGSTGGAPALPGGSTTQKSARELTMSKVRGPVRLTKGASIDDSALRAFTAKSIPRQPITRKGGLHINRSLEFGLQGAPDFASVNSVAGDKAGSTFGLTVDYKFANRWYIGSGLLFTRKNFAAAPQSYHVSSSYLSQNGMDYMQFVQGRLNMLEIPLNLRYDFSTTGNTLFFASVGASSYLFTSENCSYYYNHFGRLDTKEFQYSDKPDYLFSSISLSMGVETGISNSLSLLIAPYVKIPTSNIGFGQVQLSSFGIDFALKFAPVISRKR